MKHLFLILLCISTISAIAQEQIVVEVIRPLSYFNPQVSYVVDIPQTKLTDAEEYWHKYIGKGSKGKAVSEDGVHLQMGVASKSISSERFDVYSTMLETPEGVRLTAWMMQNNSALLSEDPARLDLAIEKYVRQFAVDQYRKTIRKELEAAERHQRDMQKELSLLIKAQEKDIKRINKNERSNVSSENAIYANDRNIINTSDRISDQHEMVDRTASDPNAQKGANKTLRGLKTKRKNLLKDNMGHMRNIDDRNKENREAERDISVIEQMIAFKTAEIEDQREAVRAIRSRLENIR